VKFATEQIMIVMEELTKHLVAFLGMKKNAPLMVLV